MFVVFWASCCLQSLHSVPTVGPVANVPNVANTFDWNSRGRSAKHTGHTGSEFACSPNWCSSGFHGIPSICQRMSMNLRCCPNWQGTRGTRPTCKTFATDFRTVKVRVCHANAHARSISFMCLHLFHECSVSCVQMLQTVKHLPRRTSQNCGSLWPISRSRASPGNGRNFGHFVKQSPCYRHLTKSYLFLGKNNDAESRSWHAGCTREWHYKRVENQYFHPPRSIVFHLFLKSKMHGYTFIEDSVPCRKAFRHDLGMTSWIQRLQWIQW